MNINELIDVRCVNLNGTATSKIDALNQAIKLMKKSGNISNIKKYTEGVFIREHKSTTGIGEGIAIPHCKSKAVTKASLAILRLTNGGVDFESLDGEKVELIFLIAAPFTNDNVHLEVLAKLSNILMHNEYVFALKKAKSIETFMNILDYAESTIDLAKSNKKLDKFPKILAATACPTGIAHTYMAQESLEKEAKKLGLSIKVETNGTVGVKNALTDEEIEHAEGIIVAADAYVEMTRFNGKRVVQCSVSKAIKDPKSLIDRALDPITSVYGSGRKPTKQDKLMEGNKFHIFYKHLMSGISHMIPFVVAGGILLAIAYLIDGLAGAPKVIEGEYVFGSYTLGAKIFHMLGAELGLGLMLPVLAGFISYSIAGRAGLVAGFVGGFSATKGYYSLLYLLEYAKNPSSDIVKTLSNSCSGFLGAILAGFMAGYGVLLLQRLMRKTPKTFEGVRDMLIIPLISTFVIGMIMFLVNVPISYINIGVCMGIEKLADIGLVVLVAFLVSALMAVDMGGPINKAAHYATLAILSSALLSSDQKLLPTAEKLLCANLVGIITPPVGIAIATWLFPQKFSKVDRATSIPNCLTGVCGITEGAIPHLVKDPVRVLISCVMGAGVGGVISYIMGGQAIAPEGGTISMLVMGVEGKFWAGLVGVAVGSIITGLLLGLLKLDADPTTTYLGKWKGIPTPGIKFKHDKKEIK